MQVAMFAPNAILPDGRNFAMLRAQVGLP